MRFVLCAAALSLLPGAFGEAPSAVQMNAAKLRVLTEELAQNGTTAFLVTRYGKTIEEWYAPGFSADRPQGTASLAKALVAGTALAITMLDGRIRPDDLASKYIPQWRGDPLKSRITIRQLATHTSGIEDAEEGDLPHVRLSGWKGAFWRREPDPFTVAIRDAPVVAPPGSKYIYSNPGIAALGYAITASLHGSADADIESLLRHRVFEPLGIPRQDWSIGYDRAVELDGMKLYATWGGARFTPRAVARIGEMMGHHGSWRGLEILKPATVDRAIRSAGMPSPDRRASNDLDPVSGFCWYSNADRIWPTLPEDAFAGAGAGHELLLVVPSLGLVVVRNGTVLTRDSGAFWRRAYDMVFAPVLAAIEPDRSPYPGSRAMRHLEFAPLSSIIRLAPDSDNWPLTWGDDDLQYTAYGDGFGFDPRVEKKLSLGFGSLAGTPDAPIGSNIRSASGERTGEGRAGQKASGMLMVDGVLYMWVRNPSHAQLAWSSDYGQTWQWGMRLETSFGSPSFLQFGKNYEGAHDRFVYTYSQDGPGAYDSDDGVVLARVDKARIRERDAYEFFSGYSESGQPQWSRAIEKRRPVFQYPGHCQRVDAVYNSGLRRYMLAVGFNHESGWGIFDAPTPWGPWTTVFHTSHWDAGPTHGYRIPAKWISPDGKSMTLVFSGLKQNDALCIRKMFLTH